MRVSFMFAALFAALVALTPGPARAYRTAAVGAGIVLTGSAAAADRWDGDRRYERGRRVTRERRWHRERRYSRNGGNWRWRTACHTQWRNGRRERVCRRTRYR